jgi:hypothetical protein
LPIPTTRKGWRVAGLRSGKFYTFAHKNSVLTKISYLQRYH